MSATADIKPVRHPMQRTAEPISHTLNKTLSKDESGHVWTVSSMMSTCFLCVGEQADTNTQLLLAQGKWYLCSIDSCELMLLTVPAQEQMCMSRFTVITLSSTSWKAACNLIQCRSTAFCNSVMRNSHTRCDKMCGNATHPHLKMHYSLQCTCVPLQWCFLVRLLQCKDFSW